MQSPVGEISVHKRFFGTFSIFSRCDSVKHCAGGCASDAEQGKAGSSFFV
jgi:hypothetical protein